MENSRNFKVLVVDDDEDTVSSLSELLQINGFVVESARSGTEALELAEDMPDVVILDLLMPDMDGWTLAKWLSMKEKPPFLIAVTGCDGNAERRRSTEAGIHLHLMKPISPAYLVGVLVRFERVVALNNDPDCGNTSPGFYPIGINV
jgi:CheY-like chemotaxis protein